MTQKDFERVVRQTIEEIPQVYRSQLDNIDITIEERPTKEILENRRINRHSFLLGLYQGVPKTKRFGYSLLPDKITLFREPILQIASDTQEAKRIIRSTVLHELGHHFGLSDQELEILEKKYTSK